MKTTKKLTMAFLMVMVALLAFVGSTFAWMTVTGNVTTNDVSGTLVGTDGVFMRLKKDSQGIGEGWGTSVDISSYTKSSGINPVCVSRSSALDSSAKIASTDYTFKKLSNGYTFDEAVANTDYIEFELQFYSIGGTTISCSNIQITADDDALKSALRIAFISDRCTGYKAYPTDSTHGIGVTGAPEGLYSFYAALNNPYFKTFCDAGVLNSADGSTATIKSTNYTTYSDDQNNITCWESTYTNLARTQLPAMAGGEVAEGDVKTVKVIIWVEGWDNLATNVMAKKTFSVSFRFAPGA